MTTEDPEKTYELAAPVSAIPCWAIYADYDGNAPDTEDLVLCASEELAKEVCGLLHEHIDNEDNGEIPYRHERWEGFSLPYIEGWWPASKIWKCHRVVREDAQGICKTVTECLEALDGTPVSDEGCDDCEECGAPPGQCDPRCGQDDRLA